jgi:ABC-type glycerol-3-phosphate transport system permease component
MSRRNRRFQFTAGLSSICKHVLLLLMTAATLFPIYFMVVSSFKEKSEYVHNKLGLPIHPILSNFTEVFKGQTLPTWFANSAILTFSSVAITTLLACMSAYAFSRMDFRGKTVLFNLIISFMVIPPIVMVIPLFVLMTRVGLINTYYSAILIYTGLLLPFSVYLLRNFFLTIPNAIVDSAKIDGCSDFNILWLIIAPLSRPALVTLTLVNALWVWNELLIALIFLQSEKMKTLMVGLTVMQGRFQINQPLIMAGMFVAGLPMLLLYLFGQKYFIRGLIAGSLKGE